MTSIAASLRFIKGSTAKKVAGADLQSLTHYSIVNNTVMGFNGVLSMCHPFPLDLQVNPDARSFLAAINLCGEQDIDVHVTPTDRLVLKTDTKRAVVKCLADRIPVPLPDGQRVDLHTDIIPHLKAVSPFISADASRPWSRGILIGGNSLFATNNLVLVEQFVQGLNFPTPIVIPKDCVDELIRIGEEPDYCLVADQHLSFIYGDNKWIRTQILENGYPDLYAIFNVPGANPTPVPEGFFEAVDSLKPFLDDMERVNFTGNGIATSKAPIEAPEESAAYIDIPGLPSGPVMVHKYLKMIQNVTEKIDFTTHPKPCLFYGNNGTLRGVVVGLAERYGEDT